MDGGLTVFFDGSCRLCRSEMEALKAVDEQGWLELVDCSPQDFDDTASRAAGATREAMMQSIHVRDVLGDWHHGVDALSLIYGTLGFSATARLWTHPRLRWLTEPFYAWVARHRYTLSGMRLHRLTPVLMRVLAWRATHQPHCHDGACAAVKGRA